MSTTANIATINQSQTLLEIENLINQIIDTSEVTMLRTLYQNILDAIPRYLAVYSPCYTYPKEIEFFLKNLHHLNVARRELNNDLTFDIQSVEDLVKLIVEGSKQDWFRRLKYDRLYQSKKTHDSLVQYAASLHRTHSRLLVIRVDFYYSKEARLQITIETAYQHLEKMIQVKYTNTDIFEHLVGSIWRAEQGGETGSYHFHMAYYFLGSKHLNDWFKAQQIGELWKSVTEGLGTYHSCNTPEVKNDFQKRGTLGVGMIHRDQPNEVKKAINAISYLAHPSKQDQYLRIRPIGRREFSTGIVLKQAIYDWRYKAL